MRTSFLMQRPSPSSPAVAFCSAAAILLSRRMPSVCSPSLAPGGGRGPALRSPEIVDDQKVTFRLRAPNATEVAVNGDWPARPRRQDDQGRRRSLVGDRRTLNARIVGPHVQWRRDPARPLVARGSAQESIDRSPAGLAGDIGPRHVESACAGRRPVDGGVHHRRPASHSCCNAFESRSAASAHSAQPGTDLHPKKLCRLPETGSCTGY
ncbi:MAG: putative esterase [Candidatus Solibacter sp.]|nr:putative esterase [Candidatus Solibacter sp.]